MRRSSHIAVKVPANRAEEAVEHYKAVLGVEERSRTDGGVELVGPNFTLWVDVGDPQMVLQEFVTADGPGTRARLEANGCRVLEESSEGFHVEDPYGMRYHVFIDTQA